MNLYTTWVWSNSKSDWRAVKSKRKWQKEARSKYTGRRAGQLQKILKEKKRITTVRLASKGKPMRAPKGKHIRSQRDLKWIIVRKWLHGDLDANIELMYLIALVAKGLKMRLYIAEGTRGIASQWKYWIAYKAGRGPLAAFPGTSNHTWGKACDTREKMIRASRNIGDIPGARRLMAKHGLCLPVSGETWHVEQGNDWKA